MSDSFMDYMKWQSREARAAIESARADGTLLTQEQVNGLPVGAVVAIHWSGGNGPALYRIAKSLYGSVYFDRSPHADPITFVGTESFHTKVTLFVSADMKADCDRVRSHWDRLQP